MPPRLPPITAAKLLDAEMVGEARLRVDPVFDGHQRKSRRPTDAPVDGLIDKGPGRAEAAAEIVEADDEETIGIERFPRPDHVVPPAHVFAIVGVIAGDVVRRIEGVADQDRVAAIGVERSVRFEGELVIRQGLAAGEREWRIEMRALRHDRANRTRALLGVVSRSGACAAGRRGE
jgi:hypothetical protein